jgi:hypothetical protein
VGLLLAGYDPTPALVEPTTHLQKCRWCLERLPPEAFSRIKLTTNGKSGTRFNKHICSTCAYSRRGNV